MKATARVRVTVLVKLDQPWPASSSVEDILKTAKSEALERVRTLIERDSSVGMLNEALVDVMLHEEAK